MEIANILFSWFKHKFIYRDVRALNATIIVHSTLKTIVGKKYCVWRWQMNYLADSSTSPYVLMLDECYNFHTFNAQQYYWKGNCAWRSQMSYSPEFITSPYVLMLECWMLPFSYIQRPTALLVRDIVSWRYKWGFYSRFNHKFICPDVRALSATIFVHSTPNNIIDQG